MLSHVLNSKGGLRKCGLLFIGYLLVNSIFRIYLKTDFYSSPRDTTVFLQMKQRDSKQWIDFSLSLKHHLAYIWQNRINLFKLKSPLFLFFGKILLKHF